MFFSCLFTAALAAALPQDAIFVGEKSTNMTDSITSHVKRSLSIHGLPHPWMGIFEKVASIQPPLPGDVFTHFFAFAAKQAAADLIPGRTYQRITYGSLVLEFWAQNRDVVTMEFIQAVAVWLGDAAEKGWPGFFQAWVIDQADKEIVCIQMGTVWDSVWGQTLDWL